MTSSNKIKDFFRNKTKKVHIRKSYSGFDMHSIWSKLLLIFVIINIIIIVASVYLFFQINSGEIFLAEDNTNVSVETIDRVLLLDTINSFNIRVQEFDILKVSSPTTIDPSL